MAAPQFLTVTRAPAAVMDIGTERLPYGARAAVIPRVVAALALAIGERCEGPIFLSADGRRPIGVFFARRED